MQSLLATCQLHDINPYDYFVDVRARVGQHPASLMHQLTPRMWKEMFAENRYARTFMTLAADILTPSRDRLCMHGRQRRPAGCRDIILQDCYEII